MSEHTIYLILGGIVIIALVLPFIGASFKENKHRLPKPPRISVSKRNQFPFDD